MIRKYLIVLYILLILALTMPASGLKVKPSWHENRIFSVYIEGGISYFGMKVVGITVYNGTTLLEFKNINNDTIILVPMDRIRVMLVE